MKVIRGGTVVTASDAGPADVLIDGETIAAVGRIRDVDAEVIDATGCYVLPGAIDNHTHMKMPFGGTWSIDDYDTGTQAAAAGGTTSIVDFSIQVHPDGLLQSSTSGRAGPRAPRTSTTASTWRSRTPTTRRSPTWPRSSMRA